MKTGKRVFFSELAYVVGMITLAIGTAFMERADFGISMVVAPDFGIASKIVFYALGMVLCSVGVAFFFKTYISPEAYELFVRDVSVKYNVSITRVKTIYDVVSCLTGIVLSFVFFGFGTFEGVKLGTVFCALINGFMIGKISGFLDTHFDFRDAFKFRDMFSK
mgnify:CR=1 FL=1